MKDFFGSLFLVVVIVAGIGGYIANIVKLIAGNGEIGLLIARAVGVLVPPLGVALGLFF